jgi:hypothetical protein
MSFVESYNDRHLYILTFRNGIINNSTRNVPKIDWKLIIEASTKTNYDVSKILKKSPRINLFDMVKDSDSDSEGLINISDSEGSINISDSEGLINISDSEGLINISDNVLLSNLHESKNNVSHVMNMPITQHDETLFWRIISSIRCLDKDEGRMTNRSIKLSNAHKKHVLRMLHGKYFAELQQVIVDVPLPFDDEKTRHNFMSHIIAKGKSFYNGILTTPVVCLYLCDNYYPIHDWISS